MNIDNHLMLVKARLGITKNIRDDYLKAIINGVINEMETKGLSLDFDNPYHLMFVVDFSCWRYENKDNHDGIPRHLQIRFHDLKIDAVK